MNNKIKIGIAMLLLVILSNIILSPAVAEPNPCTYMQPDRETRLEWINLYEKAPNAYIDPVLESPRGSYSLLSHLNYIPEERDQGICGNCWLWAGTGVLEIALDVDENINDRLSIQYPNSCKIDDYACCGGWLTHMADWYDNTNTYCIPWSNTNAEWEDDDRTCSMGSSDIPCVSISTSPNYPILDCTAESITTQSVGQSTAIENIKNVLNQDKAVWFAYYLPTGNDWVIFGDFWQNNDESTIWNPDYSCGNEYTENGGGHAVLCVGYNDDDPDNSYWIMVNSWGTTTDRPNGLFRLDMNMNYDCYFFDPDPVGYYSFYWQTLDVDFNVQQTFDQLTLSKEDNIRDCVEPEDEITYTINYNNPNNEEVHDVVITDQLPDDVIFVSATDGGVYDAVTHTVTWDIGIVGENSVEYYVYLTVEVDTECTTIENCCEITSEETDPTEACETTEICCPHDVPVLTPSGIIILIGLMMMVGLVVLRRKE